MNNPLQILYITYDGVMEPIGQSQVLSYLKRLSERGTKFHLISFEKERYTGLRIKDQGSRVVELREELERYSIEWHMLKYHKRIRILSTLFDVIRGIFQSIAVMKKTKMDIIHARSYVACLIAWIASLSMKVKFVFDMRGFWADERVDAGLLQKRSLIYKVIKKLERIFIYKADRIIVLTNRAKEELVLNFNGIEKDKIEVIPCCTDVTLFRFDKDARSAIRSEYNASDRLIFVHTGSLIGWYMVREMLEYFKSIKEIEPKALFMTLSPGQDLGNFYSTVNSLGISEKDIILTEVPFEDVNRYLSAADAGLFFIKPTFSKKASSPIKLAEYLSCGLPVICNRNIGDLDDIIEGNRVGILVNNFNKDSYKDSHKRFLKLLEDKDLKQRCRKVAEELFSLEKGAESYLGVYKSII